MNLRFLGLALAIVAACGTAPTAHAEPEHERIATERAAANAKLAAQERECASRFIVAACLDDARTAHRVTLARLRQQELVLDEGRRRDAAEARRKAIAEKAQVQQARASDAPPEPPRVRVRRGSGAASAAEGAVDDAVPAPSAGPRSAHAVAPHKPPAVKERGPLEQRNLKKFEARERAAQAHRDEVARRNAQRAAGGKVAAPLPTPQAASAPR